MEMKQYWSQTLPFEEYLQLAERKAKDFNDDKQPYYQLGVQRMNRTLKTFKIDEEKLETLKAKNFQGKILIITEAWCGDASTTVPAVVSFFEKAGIETRLFLRDSDTSLIQKFLTNGTQGIPKIIILNEDFSVKNSWGPRSKYGTELLQKFKENPEQYPREVFYNDLQIYYAKNKGKDAIAEILDLI